nr:CapA family protein [Lachnospiraceae bacterium]
MQKKHVLLFVISFSAVVLAGLICMSAVLMGSPGREGKGALFEEIPDGGSGLPSVEDIAPRPSSDEGDRAEDAGASEGSAVTDTVETETTEPEEDFVTFSFGGDILFDPHYAVMSTLRSSGGNVENVISHDLLEMMRQSDVTVLNNEFPYSNRGFPTEGKTYTFRAEPSSARYLLDMGVDLVTLANNHAYDHGEEALIDTFSALNDVGVTYIGAGMNLEEAVAAARYDIRGTKVSVLSATQIERLPNPDTREATPTSPGVFRCMDNTKLLARISEEKALGYFVIVCIHWGTENEEEVDWLQQKQGPEMAEAGADLIIGCHPHILQPVARIGDTPVIYSLGNFWFNSKTLDTCLVQAKIREGELLEVRMIPCIQSGCTTSVAAGADKAR